MNFEDGRTSEIALLEELEEEEVVEKQIVKAEDNTTPSEKLLKKSKSKQNF